MKLLLHILKQTFNRDYTLCGCTDNTKQKYKVVQFYNGQQLIIYDIPDYSLQAFKQFWAFLHNLK